MIALGFVSLTMQGGSGVEPGWSLVAACLGEGGLEGRGLSRDGTRAHQAGRAQPLCLLGSQQHHEEPRRVALLRDRTGSPDPGHPKEKDEFFWQPSRPDTREGCISRPQNPLVQPAVEGLRTSGHQGLGGGRTPAFDHPSASSPLREVRRAFSVMRGPRCVAGSGLELATLQDDDGDE